MLSAIRPAQPVLVPPLWAAFCHSSCWSGWEKRLAGVGMPPGLILGRSQWLHQRAHIGDKRQVAAVEQRLGVGQAGMQAIIAVGLRAQRQQTCWQASASGPRMLEYAV